MQEKVFDLVLDKDEKVAKMYKPNKTRALLVTNVMTVILTTLFALIFLIPGILALAGVIQIIEEGQDDSVIFGIVMLIFGSILLLIMILLVVYNIVKYKKTFYAITNKRIIIRAGFIGVDYNALDLRLIGNVGVYVGLLDKFVQPNTGSIRFGSNSTPITSQGTTRGMGGLTFSAIDDAYVAYREIKEFINKHNDKKTLV